MTKTSSIKWEAAQWIERRMDGDAFDEEAFESWLATDPHHRPIFDTMWRRIMGSDMDAAMHAYGHRGTTRQAWVAGSMVVLLAVAGGYKALPLVELHLARPQVYAVAEGKLREVTLADGSRLTLAGGAEIKVRYTRYDRVVELAHGTIFANVAHDEQRPFRVDTGNARIEDVGTSFEVLSKPANIRVTVASGVVRFGQSGWFSKPVNLIANQAATLNGNGLNRVVNVTPNSVANWRSEWAEYKGAPLWRVIDDLQTLSPLPIQIMDESLVDKPMSGRIRLTDPVGQLQNLAIIYDFRVHRTDNAIVISRK